MSVLDKVKNKVYGSFSIRYTQSIVNSQPVSTSFEEVSVCQYPVFDKCKIIVSAARSTNTENTSDNGDKIGQVKQLQDSESNAEKKSSKEKLNNHILNIKTVGDKYCDSYNNNNTNLALNANTMSHENTDNKTGDTLPVSDENNSSTLKNPGMNVETPPDVVTNSGKSIWGRMNSSKEKNTDPSLASTDNDDDSSGNKKSSTLDPKVSPLEKNNTSQEVSRKEFEKYKEMIQQLANENMNLREEKELSQTKDRNNRIQKNQDDIQDFENIWKFCLDQEEVTDDAKKGMVDIFVDENNQDISCVLKTMMTDLRGIPALEERNASLENEINRLKKNQKSYDNKKEKEYTYKQSQGNRQGRIQFQFQFQFRPCVVIIELGLASKSPIRNRQGRR